MARILIEGYTPDEILSFSPEEMNEFIFTDETVVFKAGSAEILGNFAIRGQTLVLELAQIDGGGEGVLPTLWLMTDKFARQNGLAQVEWLVHAINCAKPNLKLRRILQRRGFQIETLPEIGEVYRYVHVVQNNGFSPTQV